MDAKLGNETDALTFLADVAREPYRYDFYQTLRRLECLYGPDHALNFLESSPGLTVEMHLPFRRVSSGSDQSRTRVA